MDKASKVVGAVGNRYEENVKRILRTRSDEEIEQGYRNRYTNPNINDKQRELIEAEVR